MQLKANIFNIGGAGPPLIEIFGGGGGAVPTPLLVVIDNI